MRAVLDVIIITESKVFNTKSGIALPKPIIQFLVHDFGPLAGEAFEMEVGDQVVLHCDATVTGFVGPDQKSSFGAVRASEVVVIIPHEEI